MENIQQKILNLLEVEKKEWEKEWEVNASPADMLAYIESLLEDEVFMGQADAEDVAFIVAISHISSFGLSPSDELSEAICNFISDKGCCQPA